MASQLASDRDESMPDPPDATISPQVEDDEDQQRIKIVSTATSAEHILAYVALDRLVHLVLRRRRSNSRVKITH